MSVIIFFALLVPPLPIFPDLQQEGWMFALNQAVATHLIFGYDVVLNQGPYVAAYTSQYYPGTEAIRLLGQSTIALAYSIALLTLLQGVKRWLLLPFFYLLSVIEQVPVFSDAVFYFLSWLFLLLAYRYASDSKIESDWKTALSLSLILPALAVVTLVKASFNLGVISLGALALCLIGIRNWRFALALLSLFILGVLAFWMIAGQPLDALPSFFRAQLPLIYGYSDALSSPGRGFDIISYLAVSVVVVVSLTLASFTSANKNSSFIVLAGAVALLFLSFKAGFIRHGAHGMIAADVLALVCLSVVTLLPRWNAIVVVCLGLVSWFSINAHYTKLPANHLEALVEGIRCWGKPAQLTAHYMKALRVEATEIPLPSVSGTADIHDARYDLLVANGLEMKQRPIAESYTTYEPELAQRNASFFQRKDRPDNLFFKATAVDGRLPSLEDSLSWPLWLSVYEVSSQQCPPFILLTKRDASAEQPELIPIIEKTVRMGERVPLPQGGDLLWAEIQVPSTLLGSAASFFYKRPGLKINYRYADQAQEDFRYIEGMGRAGFLISPVVHDNKDFVAIASTSRQESSRHLPASFSLTPEDGGKRFWKRTYRVRISSLKLHRAQE